MSASPSPDRAAPSPWITVAVLVVLGVVSMLDRQIISLMVGPIKADLGLSDFQLGLLQGISFAIFYSTLGIPLGYAADRFPRRIVIFGGVFVWAAAAMLSGLAQNYEQLLLARVFIGIGEAALAPSAYSMITDLFPPWRLGRALSVYAYGSAIGAALATAIGGAMLGISGALSAVPLFEGMASWQIGFILTGAPGVVLSLLIFAVPEPRRRRSATEPIGSWADVAKFMHSQRAFFACHFGGFALLMMICYGIMSWTPAVLMRVYGWPADQTGYVYAIYTGVTSLAALTVNGAVVDWMFARGHRDAHLRIYVFGSLLVALCGLTVLTATTAHHYLLLLTPALWIINIYGVSAAAVQIVTPSHMRGRVSSLFLLVLNLTGLGFGPLTVAALTSFVFRDEAKVLWSISTTMIVFAPIAAALFWRGLAPMRRAVAAAGIEERPARRAGAHLAAGEGAVREVARD